MNALVGFTALEIEDIDYIDGTVCTKLNKGHKGIIYALQSMAIYRRGQSMMPFLTIGMGLLEKTSMKTGQAWASLQTELDSQIRIYQQQPLHPPLSDQETLSLIS
jgi:hypothetical protein